jgi:23S rRNA (cytidine2498-2'-O)-methyltransferase
LPGDHKLADDFRFPSAFARSSGFSLGQLAVQSPPQAASQVWQLVGEMAVTDIHVWQRDAVRPGDTGYEPAPSAAAREVHRLLRRSCPSDELRKKVPRNQERPARKGHLVMDCVLVDSDRWWVGYHRVGLEESRWPGGAIPLQLPRDAVSRAWLKMEEALRWSRLPIGRKARVAELGCAPGGAAQALLDRGCEVLGVDPAEVDPRVLAHPNFRQLRSRARQVRRRDLSKVRWLVADMNVAPTCTLDAVEEIVLHPRVNVRGMLLTLKLTDWSLAARLPEWILRIRGWGYNLVRPRQLVHNRQEICVAAQMKPFRRKPPSRG